MSDRPPSWMPTDDEIARAERLTGPYTKRLIEITGLKAQIEVADEIAKFKNPNVSGYDLASRLAGKLRARLSELEAEHE